MGKAIVRRYPFPPCVQCFRVSVIHRTLKWIFNVRTFLCVCIHTGMGHTDNESAQHFDSEKLSQIFIVLRAGFQHLVMQSIGSRLEADALPTKLPRPHAQDNANGLVLIEIELDKSALRHSVGNVIREMGTLFHLTSCDRKMTSFVWTPKARSESRH